MAYDFDSSGLLKPPTPEQIAAMDQGGSVIVLSQGTREDGGAYWAYVAIKPSCYGEYLRLTAGRASINLEEYGTIILYGLEADVPESVRQVMARDYACDDDYLNRLKDDVLKAQAAFFMKKEDQRIGDIVSMLKAKQAERSFASS